MDAPPTDYRLMRFGSESFPPDKRLAVWQAMLTRKLIGVTVQQLTNQPFFIDASLRILPDCRFGIGRSSPSAFHRTPELVAADNDDVLLIVSMEGSCKFATETEEVPLEEGDGYLLSCLQAGSFTWNANTRYLCARFNRAKVSELVPNLEGALGRVIPRGTESLRLLSFYMRTLDDGQNLATPELVGLVTTHIYELLALALNATSPPASPFLSNGLGTMWHRTIKKYITAKLDQQDLSIVQVARVHKLSSRHVQRILEAEGTTFSEFVLAKRLERTRAALSDPRQIHRAISDIALSSGFGDVSHFNRAFRKHYGESPSQVRKKSVLQKIET